MDQEIRALTELHENQCARISTIHGGHGFLRKLHIMGIKEGQTIKVVSKQPFRGPLTIQVCGSQMTIGRGMAQRILVEVVS
jgi:ferrous iron transport protein A